EGSRRAQVVALKDLSLDVTDGEFVCLVGGSGCGKTTFLNLVAGFLQPTDGAIYLRGEPIVGIEPRAGMIFQSYALFPWKTVAVTHNIDEALILADRIIVMSSRPGRVKASIRNDLPRPRQVAVQLSPRYLELKTQIWGYVEEEVRQQIEATARPARGQ